VPGKSEESLLIELITSDDSDEQMPPSKKPRLRESEIQSIRQWIDQGMDWPDEITFSDDRYEPPLKPRKPELPPSTNGTGNPIDRIVEAYFNEKAVTSRESINDSEFLRRLSLDLIGFPPSPEQLLTFLLDQSGERRERIISKLLNRKQAYAEHWMTFWNDLLRNNYSGTGFIDDGRRQITGWLYQALLDNKPFDQFTRELIAPTPGSEGFIRGIKWRGNVNASQSRELQFSQNISQVFLGINMKCASCHDSFIDRWTLKEAYGLASIYSQKPLELTRCDIPTGEMAQAAWIFPELGTLDPEAEQPERLKQLSRLMTHPDNGRFARTIVNRLWKQLMGRGIVHPVDAMHTRPWSEDLLDFLGVYLVEQNYDLKKVIQLIVSTRIYQSKGVHDEQKPDPDAYVFRGPIMKRMTAEQFLDSIWSITRTWPEPDKKAFKLDGRKQGGQLTAVLRAQGENVEWENRALRAVFTPQNRFQASLGRPSREQVVTDRPDLLTTLEAIYLSNGPVLAKTLSSAAEHILEKWNDNPEGMILWLFNYSLSRNPTVSEQQILQDLVGKEPVPEVVEDLLWAVFMLPEFQYIN
jgi:hypothetical protein